MPGRGSWMPVRGCWTPGRPLARPVWGRGEHYTPGQRFAHPGGVWGWVVGVTQLAGAVTHQQEGHLEGGVGAALHICQGLLCP